MEIVTSSHRFLSDKRTSSLYETRWTTAVEPKAGDRLDLGLKVATWKPPHDLPTIKHPLVRLIDMGSNTTQRQTGRNSTSRSDAVCGR